MTPRTLLAPALLGTLIAVAPLSVSGSAQALGASAGATGIYKNCTAFHARWPHGVGRVHAHDHTSGTPVTDFKRSNRLYRIAMQHNSDLDRDKDHIACEKAQRRVVTHGRTAPGCYRSPTKLPRVWIPGVRVSVRG